MQTGNARMVADHCFEKKKVPKPDDQLYAEWVEKYGEKGANVIRDTVAKNVEDYEYLKQFAIRV